MLYVGPIQLPQPETGDDLEPFFLGQDPDGGFWTAMSRLSYHDHSGGLLGAPISVLDIPDGSITADDLHPSVLAPYALLDGSEPFTGQVEMEADAVVRDRLWFGEQGTALAPDAYWERAGVNALRTDSKVGVGVAPAAWIGSYRVLQVGQTGAFYDGAGYSILANNTYEDAGGNKALAPGLGTKLLQNGGQFLFQTAPYVDAAGAAQTFTTRLAVAQTGTVTLTPDAGQPALVAERVRGTATGGLMLDSPGGTNMGVDPTGNFLYPVRDNAISNGGGANRWTAVFAVAGSINTSAADLKQDITPLDPAAALAAVLATDPVVFDYKPPVRDASWYELPDDLEQAEQVLYERMTSEPLMAAARHQAGFVLASPDYATDPLFETGAGQSNAANSVGVILAALHAIDARLTAGGL